MRVARRAGNQVASSVGRCQRVNALAKAGGSNAPISNKIPLRIFPVAAASQDEASPLKSMTEPSAHEQAQHHPGLRPSACESRFSRVRRATEYALTP